MLNFLFFLPVFFVFAIFVFRETRLFRNLGSFAKLRNSRNSCLIFAKHENRFVASFAKFSRNEISSKTLLYSLCLGITLSTCGAQEPAVYKFPKGLSHTATTVCYSFYSRCRIFGQSQKLPTFSYYS
jgi:hypothetical protein